jgi:hypothetical protein
LLPAALATGGLIRAPGSEELLLQLSPDKYGPGARDDMAAWFCGEPARPARYETLPLVRAGFFARHAVAPSDSYIVTIMVYVLGRRHRLAPHGD